MLGTLNKTKDAKLTGGFMVAILSGKLPTRALGLVIEGTALHQDELLDAWKAHHHESPGKIVPLL
jgi:hypothetical protein